MPRRRHESKRRRRRLADLSFADWYALEAGWLAPQPWQMTAMRTMEDVRAIWEEVRTEFLAERERRRRERPLPPGLDEPSWAERVLDGVETLDHEGGHR